jgi:hypothetical protein
MDAATVELANRQGRAKRLILLCIGLWVGVWPLWDLWPGVAQITPVAPFFWIIVLGALFIAAMLVGGSVFGWSTVLTIAPDRITLERENLVRRELREVAARDIGTIGVVAVDWSDGPTTYHVSLALKGEGSLASESTERRDEAEALARTLRAALGRPA